MIKIRIIFEFKRKTYIQLGGKKAFGFSPEATRGQIEQNITKCTFLQSRAGQYEKKFISLYFLADLQYTVHISAFCIWIKQMNKVNVTMYAYIMRKKG